MWVSETYMTTWYLKIAQRRKIKVLGVCLLLFLCSSHLAYAGESSAEPSEFEKARMARQKAVENIEFLLLHGQDYDILEAIEPASPLPESLWKKIAERAGAKEHLALRQGLLIRYRESLPENGENSEINALFFDLAAGELKEIQAKEYHSDVDLNRLEVTLESIISWKEPSLFYEVAAFAAYPLSDIRELTYRAFAVLEDDRMFPLVLDLASSQNPVERTYAIDALYYIRDERTIPILLNLTTDPNKSVRYYAIRTLEKMDANEAIPYYFKIIRSDKNNEVRIKAIEIIGRKLPRGGFFLVNAALSDPDPGVREASIEALVAYGNFSAGYSLSNQLAHEKLDHLKLKEIQAMIALKSGGRLSGIHYILQKENNPQILIWALYAAGVLKDYRGIGRVIALLKHEHEGVRIEAAFALGSLRRSAAVEPLGEAIRRPQESYEVKSAVLYALEQINTRFAKELLVEISQNQSDPYLRGWAQKILEKKGRKTR